MQSEAHATTAGGGSGVGATASGMGRFRFSFRQKKRKEDRKVQGLRVEKLPKFISQAEAKQIEQELLVEYDYLVEQVTELAGFSCALIVAKTYPKEAMTKFDGALLVCCGPGNNGAVGLVCARHLKILGYRTTIFYPRTPSKTLYKHLINQCEKIDIPFLSYMPSEAHLLDSSYEFVIDAIFGFNFTPPIRPEFIDVIQRLRQMKIPIVSIDIPSGWNVEDGGDADSIQPDTLISLAVPKLCARCFRGRYHYLGGRFLPPSLCAKYNLDLPAFPSPDPYILLQAPEIDQDQLY